MLHGGVWDSGQGPNQVVTTERVAPITNWAPVLASSAFRERNSWVVQPGSQNYYGYLWWTNRTGEALGPDVPRDAFYMSGYSMKNCIVIPSLDMVIVRLGSNRVLNKHPEFYREFASRIVKSAIK